MMISICNSNIREFGTQRPLQGAVALRLGVRTPGATKKAFAVAKAFFVVPAGHDPATP